MVGKRQGRDLTYLSPLGLEMLLTSFGAHALFPESFSTSGMTTQKCKLKIVPENSFVSSKTIFVLKYRTQLSSLNRRAYLIF